MIIVIIMTIMIMTIFIKKVAATMCIGPEGDLHGNSAAECAIRMARAGHHHHHHRSHHHLWGHRHHRQDDKSCSSSSSFSFLCSSSYHIIQELVVIIIMIVLIIIMIRSSRGWCQLPLWHVCRSRDDEEDESGTSGGWTSPIPYDATGHNIDDDENLDQHHHDHDEDGNEDNDHHTDNNF